MTNECLDTQANLTNDTKRFQLFCAIVTGMLANTNGGNLVWGNAESQVQIIASAQAMSLIAYPAELPTAMEVPAVVDAEAVAA